MHLPIGAAPRHTVGGLAAVLAGAVLLGAGPPAAAVMPAAVNLGSAARFAVLAGDGVTDDGPSVIAGDVGTHPRPAIPDLVDREATGVVHRADTQSGQAQLDLASALAAAAALRADGTVSLRQRTTVGPGVHVVSDGAAGIGTDLTLDGAGLASPVWVFVVTRDLATVPGATIRLVNGAQACSVFWLVGGSASLASGSGSAGSILAKTSVTVGRDVTITGRLLARSGAVELEGDTITIPACSSKPADAAPPSFAPVPARASTRGNVTGRTPPELPPYLPFVMIALLVASAVLGEPRHQRRRRRDRYRW